MKNLVAPRWISGHFQLVDLWRQIRDVAAINPESLAETTLPDLEFDYVDLAAVDEGTIASVLVSHRFESAPSRARRITQEGDLLVATVRPLLDGHTRVPKQGFRQLIASTGYAVLRIKDPNERDLVWHLLASRLVRRQFHAKVAGSSYPAIAESDVGEIWIPKFKEHLVDRVVRACNALQSSESILNRLIAAKREQKRGLMQQLLTGKLRFPGFTEPWKTVRIDQLGVVKSGGTPSTDTPEYWGGVHSWCTPTDVTALNTRYLKKTTRTISDSGVKFSAAELLPPQSVIVCTRATVGIAAINTIPMATNQGFKSIIPGLDVDTDFLYYAIMFVKRELLRRAAGSTFLEVSLTSFREIPILWPSSLNEQKRVSRFLGALDHEIELLEQQRAAFAAQRRGLMEKLLSGEIDIQNPKETAA